MNRKQWSLKHLKSLKGKTVVITGATGGLGSEACRYVLTLEGRIIMVNRNAEKSAALCEELRSQFPGAEVSWLTADLEDIQQVLSVCQQLLQQPVDILLLNAGTYAIPRAACSTGYDNVFQTNFVSHYCMVKQLLPVLSQRHGKVVAVGSIAHDYGKLDPEDIDFAHHQGASKIYGNSKRFLMYALTELLQREPNVDFGIGHPGISFTGITSHYPPKQLAFVRFNMRILFMWPEKAVRSILLAMCSQIPYLHWAGPRFFDIWGDPKVKALDTSDDQERMAIFQTAERIYAKILNS